MDTIALEALSRPPAKGVLQMAFDVLTFRFSGEDCERFNYKHLLFGLFTTWLVGSKNKFDF